MPMVYTDKQLAKALTMGNAFVSSIIQGINDDEIDLLPAVIAAAAVCYAHSHRLIHECDEGLQHVNNCAPVIEAMFGSELDRITTAAIKSAKALLEAQKGAGNIQ